MPVLLTALVALLCLANARELRALIAPAIAPRVALWRAERALVLAMRRDPTLRRDVLRIAHLAAMRRVGKPVPEAGAERRPHRPAALVSAGAHLIPVEVPA